MFSYVRPNAWSWSMINERRQHFGREWFFNSIFTIRFVCGYKCGKWPIKNIFWSIRMKFRARISSPSILMNPWKFVRNRQNMLRAWMKLLMSITHVSETLAIRLNREEENNEDRKLYRFYFSEKMLHSNHCWRSKWDRFLNSCFEHD